MSVDISGINREEFIKLEEARDRYIEIVDKLSIHTHAEFCEAYNALAEGYYSPVSQSTVSANFSKFDIRKNPKTKLYAHKTLSNIKRRRTGTCSRAYAQKFQDLPVSLNYYILRSIRSLAPNKQSRGSYMNF